MTREDLYTVTFRGGVWDGRVDRRYVRGRSLIVPVLCRAKSSPYRIGTQEYAWSDIDDQAKTATLTLHHDDADLASDEPVLCERCGKERFNFHSVVLDPQGPIPFCLCHLSE